MKKIFYITLFMSLATPIMHASTFNQQKIMKVSKSIKYLSQKIANDYLYLYQDRQKIEIKSQLNSSIKKLEDNFRFIAKNSDNPDTKNILDFLSYSKDQMKDTLEEDISKESVSSMLDYCNTLLEGFQSILDIQNYNSYEKKFHLMMISKLYMAINLNFDPINNKNKIEKEIKLFNNHLVLNNSWHSLKNILINNKVYFIPNIVSILVKDLENSVGNI